MAGMRLTILCDTHQAQYAATSAEGHTNKQTMHASYIAHTCNGLKFLSMGSIYGVYVWAIIGQSAAASSSATELPVRVARHAHVRTTRKSAETC